MPPAAAPEEGILVESRPDAQQDTPRMWRVLLHNDDFTTQEFVVWVLETVFHLPHADAMAIMMHVHQCGHRRGRDCLPATSPKRRSRPRRRMAEQHEYPVARHDGT